MSNNRKICICIECKRERPHYGLGMCTSCLRKMKRQTRPEFYLGTCYSELSRRIKTFDVLRPNYFGLAKCTKDEFFNKFTQDTKFIECYKMWQLSGFKRKQAPSIDRIDNNKGYTLDNIQFISQGKNSVKDIVIPTQVIDKDGLIYNFKSRTEASVFLKTTTSIISRSIKKSRPYKGYTIR